VFFIVKCPRNKAVAWATGNNYLQTVQGCVCSHLWNVTEINQNIRQMCFSPSVSFGAAAVLSVTGIAAVRVSKTVPQRILAMVPLLFAWQQLAEGFVWLSLLRPAWAQAHHIAVYVFLVFAQMVWPVYMPVCALFYEQSRPRRALIGITLAAGVALAAYIGVSLYIHPPLAFAEKHHIRYELGFALSRKWYYGVLYFIPAVFSLLLSSQKTLRILGGLFLLSYLFTRLLFYFYVISVWCFFGALISILIFVFLSRSNAKNKVNGNSGAYRK